LPEVISLEQLNKQFPASGLRNSNGHNSTGARNSHVITAVERKIEEVWLLDDDISILKSIGRLLNSAGWDVKPFTDPAQFLENARIKPPQIAVLDVLMPQMSGLEVQRTLQSICPWTRIIILTSNDDPSVRRAALEAGACAFFLKGVENEELLAQIDWASRESASQGS
jgi:FixJ family two-component response regulator